MTTIFPTAGFQAPQAMMELRTSLRESPPNVWDAESCGLIDERGTVILDGLHMGLLGDRGETAPSAADAPGSHIIRDPVYVPYESRRVPRLEAGETMAFKAFRAVFCTEIGEGVLSSPLAVTALLTTTLVKSRIWDTETPLEALAEMAPRKGGEIDRLLGEYCARNAENPREAIPMAIRDFVFLWAAACFIRGDGNLLNLTSSALSMMNATDYVDAPDGAGGGLEAEELYTLYAAAASEGLSCLGGLAATQVLRDMVVAAAVIHARKSIGGYGEGSTDIDAFVKAAGGPVTAEEYLHARWWDGGMVPYYRCGMSGVEYRHLTDELGTFTAADGCGRIKRAVDSAIRYDEAADIISDYALRESFNEVLVALAVSGKAEPGYGNALARITDDVIACECGLPGHAEAAEISMGNCLFYLLTTRYQMRQQLAAFTAAGGRTKEAYAWPPPGARLEAVARTELEKGNALHSAAWRPLWGTSGDASPLTSPRACVEALSHRVARRTLLEEADESVVTEVAAAAAQILTDCDRLTDATELANLSSCWGGLFNAAITAQGRHVNPAIARSVCDVIARIWEQAVVGNDSTPSPTRRIDESLVIDVNHVLLQTHSLPVSDGLGVRRAFIGVATSAVELSGLNPYSRLSDGASRLLA